MTFIKQIVTTLKTAGEQHANDEGQTMAEYGLILTGVALVVMATTLLLGNAIGAALNSIIALL